MHAPKSRQFYFYSSISQICLKELYICTADDTRREKQLLKKQLIKGDGGHERIEVSLDQKRRVTDNRADATQAETFMLAH